MANHTHDCKHCSADRRLNSRCCERAIEDDKAIKDRNKEADKLVKLTLHRYGLSQYASVKELVALLLRLESAGDTYLLQIAKDVQQEREAKERSQVQCTHKHLNGCSAIVSGFAEAPNYCGLCSKEFG